MRELRHNLYQDLPDNIKQYYYSHYNPETIIFLKVRPDPHFISLFGLYPFPLIFLKETKYEKSLLEIIEKKATSIKYPNGDLIKCLDFEDLQFTDKLMDTIHSLYITYLNGFFEGVKKVFNSEISADDHTSEKALRTIMNPPAPPDISCEDNIFWNIIGFDQGCLHETWSQILLAPRYFSEKLKSIQQSARQQKTALISHSFMLIDSIRKHSNLTEVWKNLISEGFIDGENANLAKFRKIFSGEEITEPIRWKTNATDLRYFVHKLLGLDDSGNKIPGNALIKDLKNQHWKVTALCFVKNDGSSWDPKNFKRLKKPNNATKKKLDSILDKLR